MDFFGAKSPGAKMSECQKHLNTFVWIPKVGKVKSLRCSEVKLGVPIYWQINGERLISSLDFKPIPSGFRIMEECVHPLIPYFSILEECLPVVEVSEGNCTSWSVWLLIFRYSEVCCKDLYWNLKHESPSQKWVLFSLVWKKFQKIEFLEILEVRHFKDVMYFFFFL